MFFISCFGSILPYILYLSLIWLCILAGFRGNMIFRGKPQVTVEKSVGINPEIISVHQQYVPSNNPYKIRKNPSSENNFVSVFSSRYSYSSKKQLIFFTSVNKEFPSCNTRLFTRRGPPITI
jgi:hypothetical protein